MGFQDEHMVDLEDGGQYALHFDMAAICAFEENSGEAIASLGGDVKMTTLVHLLAAGLRKHHPEIASYQTILNGQRKKKGRRGPPLVSFKTLEAVAEPLMSALMAAMPQEDDVPETEEESEGNDS